ncbi:helicase-related protein [Fonticella tunisiensis]|uniref:Helicase-like protein n=1 Tax=Fonticella tunisiensis TaxID=1096341 RepID=A0A4R7K6B7_9CLOT|nr:helicase-related protein [Fonticella tunisiensis]TDT46072.1 helicase-like protein [Fonticella tunisiensis]
MSRDVTIQDFINAREQILKGIRAEIIGPGSEDIGPDIEHEIITESPLQRYNVGILYPQKNVQNQENDELINTQEENGEIPREESELHETEEIEKFEKKVTTIVRDERNKEIDEQINMANQFLPSSMGLTFFAKGISDSIVVGVKYAEYRLSTFKDACVACDNLDKRKLDDPLLSEFIYEEGGKLKLKKVLNTSDINRLKAEGAVSSDEFENALYKLSAQCSDSNAKFRKEAFVRVPKQAQVTVTFEHGSNIYRKKIFDDSNLELCAFRRQYSDGIISLTIILVNTNEGKPSYRNTFFQPEISIETNNNPGMSFVEYMENPYLEKKEDRGYDEEQSLDLLYRHKKTYAIGHGVSAVYDVDEISRKGKIVSDFMPYFEVPKLNFNIEEISEISERVLPMKNLSDFSKYGKEDIISLLRQFVNAYENWIIGLEKEMQQLEEKFHAAAKRHIEKCRIALKRMYCGVDALEENENVFKAFLLANRAMLMQRVHSKIQSCERYPGESELKEIDYKLVPDSDASWRPFQLAFLLMCIKSIDDPTSFDRDIVDLIWVPTGGGKTEAYLGLTAFTIFLRRLKDPVDGGGTTILMRYTLRLLAAQQFIRSSILICACELIRREGKYKLGKEPITIGLWIGSESTPNKIQEAKELINELYKCTRKEMLESTKEKCNKFQLLKCPWCGTKLVKEIVDGEIKGEWGYSTMPNRMLFCPDEDCEFNAGLPVKVVDEVIYKNPPTLLFGTVDKFAMITWEEEVSRLFALDHGNNTKSPELIIQDELHLISGPLGTIVGLYETAIDKMCSVKGIKPKIIASTATIRRAEEQCRNLYVRQVMQFPAPGLSADDSFFTREIKVDDKNPGRLYVGIMPSGKTLTTVEIRLMATLLQKISMMNIHDEVKDKYWTLVGYFNSLRELGKCSTLVDDDVKDFMRRLANRLADKKALRVIMEADELTSRIPSGLITKTLDRLETAYCRENIENKNYPVNVLLATNMISVGVDVSRLNLMLILGQPKLTSEYIQASSRVGRTFPGLVFTLYDSAKSRDRSHYEQFYSYHQSFYKFVEPTSVTPFSGPARDRALHALLISMVRHIGGLNSEEMATDFREDMEITKEIEDYIVERVKVIDESQIDDVKNEIRSFWYRWIEKIDSLSEGEFLTYSKKDRKHLIKPFGKKDGDTAFETLQSMRNVDFESGVHIIVFGDDDK